MSHILRRDIHISIGFRSERIIALHSVKEGKKADSRLVITVQKAIMILM